MKKHTRLACAALSLLLLFGLLPTLAVAHSAERHTIKVGYMELPGYIEKGADGEYSGCGVKFLDEICKYADWNVEYVSVPWTEQLEALDRGEIDIVPMVQHSPERAEKYLFTRQPIGIIQGFLVTLPEEENGIKNNVLAYDGKTIGILSGSRNIDFLSEHAEHMGFTYRLAELDSHKQLEEALLAGKVDIIASEQAMQTEGLRVLDRFASDPYYFIAAKNNAELMQELDYAIGRIFSYDPAYSVRLHQEYYGNSLADSIPYFTKEEMQFIESHREINIALIPGNQPLCHHNLGFFFGVQPITCLEFQKTKSTQTRTYSPCI